MKGLDEALDAARRERQLTWATLMEEINRPFTGTPSIPITLSTVKGLHKKSSVTSAVVLQVLGWLRRSPESFLSDRDGFPSEDEALPESGPGRILRFDTHALYEAIEAERQRRGWTWKQVAGELPGFTESTLRHLAAGPLIGFPRVMLLTQWLNRPASSFVRTRSR